MPDDCLSQEFYTTFSKQITTEVKVNSILGWSTWRGVFQANIGSYIMWLQRVTQALCARQVVTKDFLEVGQSY